MIRKHWKKACVLLLAMAASVAAANVWMISAFQGDLYRDCEAIPENNVGLVLGTGPRTVSGTTNLHFTARINAAAQLYYSGKIKHLLLSGDNRTVDYDEPTEMKKALVAKGVPEKAMTLDYAGLRTLDSIVRAKEIFGQTNLTIVTQPFHGARAAFLARHSGVKAVVFCSDTLPWQWEVRVQAREVVARVKAVLDVFVLHRQPRHLGEKIEIKVSQSRFDPVA